MRRRFQSTRLYGRFQIAWVCVPVTIRNDLSPFIRQIREVKELAGTYIQCPDGTRYGPIDDGTGFTFFYSDDTTEFCDIVFPRLLTRFPKAATLCIMLHELAHAHDYCINRRKATRQKVIRAERQAWLKVVEWAKQANLNSGFMKAIETHAASAILVDGLMEIATKLTDSRSYIKAHTKKSGFPTLHAAYPLRSPSAHLRARRLAPR